MTFHGTPAFIEREYVIDFKADQVLIKPFSSRIYYFLDFITDLFLIKTIFYAFFTTMLLFLIHFFLDIPGFDYTEYFQFLVLFYFPIFLLFNLSYIYFNNKLTKNIQMMLENVYLIPFGWIHEFNNRNNYTIDLKDHKIIEINIDNGYKNYELQVDKTIKKNLSSIKYINKKKFRRVLKIEFDKKVTGYVKLYIESKVLDIIKR